jgi:hypothetical protein
MQLSSLPINSSLQNNPRYKFSLKSENIKILTILSAAIRSLFFLVRIFYQPSLIYMPSFVEIPLAVSDISEVKDFGHTFTVSMATAAILKIPRPECTS